jgi:hypothetical protein
MSTDLGTESTLSEDEIFRTFAFERLLNEGYSLKCSTINRRPVQ